MKNRAAVFTLVLLFSCLPNRTQNAYLREFRSLFGGLRATRTDGWDTSRLQLPLSERILPLGQEAAEYVQRLNALDDIQEKPEGTVLTDLERKKLIQEMEKYPEPIRVFFRSSVIAIFTGKNIGSSAITGTVYDDQKKPVFGFIILDTERLSRRANDWLAYKEGTAFAPEKNWSLEGSLEEDSNNTKEAATAYILLHEAGHIFHEVNHLLPSFTDENPDYSKYEFSRNVWTSENEAANESSFEFRRLLKFYSEKPALSLVIAPEVYDALDRTVWPTLYSSTSAGEDFADTFASYIHCIMQNRPYRITVKVGSYVRRVSVNGIRTERTRLRREYMEQKLNSIR